nr:adenosine kinase 2-like isoform X2 [Halyomorpha halys]
MEKILRDGMLLGMGNPLLDILAATDTAILEKYNLQPNDAILADKKHMPLYQELIENYKVEYIAAGSTLNSVRIAQWILQRPNVCAYLGSVGKDKFSQILEDKSREDGILAKFQFTTERPTGSCAVLITSNGHNRSLVANLAAAECFTKDHLDDPEVSKIVANAEIYYSSGFFLTVSIETIMEVAQVAHRRNKYFMMNLSAPFLPIYYKKQMMQAMPYVDILFGNETEALAFAKENNFEISDMKEIALKMTTLPKENPNRPRVVIITQGTLPVIVAKEGSTTEYPIPLIPTENIVDTNGAGDAFVGGFMAQFVKGESLDIAVKCAIWAAGVVVQNSGCTVTGKPNFVPY